MKYKAFPHLISVEKRLYKSYGIAAVERNSMQRVVKDVSMDKNDIKNLVKDLNEQKVSVSNLDAVLSDFFDR